MTWLELTELAEHFDRGADALPLARYGSSLIVLRGMSLIKQMMWYIKNGAYIKPPFFGSTPFMMRPDTNGTATSHPMIQAKYISLYSLPVNSMSLCLLLPRPTSFTLTFGPNLMPKKIVPRYMYEIQLIAAYFIISVCTGRMRSIAHHIVIGSIAMTEMRKRLMFQSFLSEFSINIEGKVTTCNDTVRGRKKQGGYS